MTTQAKEDVDLVEIDRSLAMEYLKRSLTPSDGLTEAFIEKALSKAQCGVIKPRNVEDISLDYSIGSSAPGIAQAFMALLSRIPNSGSLLTDDVWSLPSDKSRSEVKATSIIKTDRDRMVYTPIKDATADIREHLKSVISFLYITALIGDGVKVCSGSDVHHAINSAEAIAVPVHDGDTLLVFH